MKFNSILYVILLCASGTAWAQMPDSIYIQKNFDKTEVMIPMRDGTKLFTSIYTPKDKSKSYPILMQRTCYSVAPYGAERFRKRIGPNKYLMQDGYIFVYQDVRGRWMSEGVFDNMTPNVPGNDKKNKTAVDESSDTWDTIDWLLKNVKGNNGKVGQYGISYPGFYTAAAIPDAHPALKASSPQAPIADFFFDDFHHNGAYLQSYTAAFGVFGYQHEKPTSTSWYNDKLARFRDVPTSDGYDFNLRLGSLKNVTDKYHHDNFFWQQIVDHPNYDEFWRQRSLLPHLKNVNHAVLTVGGWFDAEDLYGPLNIYKTIEKTSPGAQNSIVMGPWAHGQWSSPETGKLTHNHIYFGDSINTFYQREVERKFFNFHLKGEGATGLPEALVFDTGKKEWRRFDAWPPKEIPKARLYFGEKGQLSINKPLNEQAVFEYISDPAKPVPYTSQTEGLVFTPRFFMSDDQRDAARRPDVLTFETGELTEDVTLAGEIMARLKVSMTGTDADFIVKVIDVYPQNHPNYDHNPKNVVMGGYQQLVRSEVMRGRFRNSFEKPEPFKANEVTEVDFRLQDLLHTFKKGHRVMIQIHSTWFPYIDRNPQKYVENIYKANDEDFIKSTIRVYGSSVIEIGGGEKMDTRIEGLKKVDRFTDSTPRDMNIGITRTKKSKLATIDFNNIPFGKYTSDHMFVMDYSDGEWRDFRIVPYQGFVLDPQSKALQYCQCIFEGMKVTMGADGIPKLLRPDLNIDRFNLSAERMCMPVVPPDVFLKALKAIVSMEKDWIPTAEGSALYVRPTMFATESSLAVTPSDTYTFYIYTGPVQPYFTTPIKLVTEQKLIRAVPGGTGEAKTGGNYAGSLKASQLAKQKGFDQIIWLESPDFEKIQEAGMMNLFFVIGDTVVTPEFTGAVLHGTTRTYFLDILKEKNIKVEVRDIYIDEILRAYTGGMLKEAFGSGTAAVVSHIAEITHGDTRMVLPKAEDRKISNMLYNEINGLRSGRIEDKRKWMVPVEIHTKATAQ